MAKASAKNQYGNESISSLKGADRVRLRPGGRQRPADQLADVLIVLEGVDPGFHALTPVPPAKAGLLSVRGPCLRGVRRSLRFRTSRTASPLALMLSPSFRLRLRLLSPF